jgi:flagellar biosynthesis protein FlhF
MSTRSPISSHRLLRAARRRRDGAPTDFGLRALAARRADAPGQPRRLWPSDDIAFLGAVLEAHQVPKNLIARLAEIAAKLPLNTLLVERLSAALAGGFRFTPLGDVLRARAILLLGPPGAGKTTLAAKIATRIGETRAMLVAVTASDAGTARIEEYGAALRIPVAKIADAAALAGCLTAAAGRQLVIDTPGASSDATLAALVAAGDALPLLVLPADGNAAEAAAMAQRFGALGAHTLLPTRLDLAHQLGGMLAAADAAGLALPAAGTTPHFALGLRPLTPGLLARRLLAGALQAERPRLPAA